MLQFDVNFPDGSYGNKQAGSSSRNERNEKAEKQRLNDEIASILGKGKPDEGIKPVAMPHDIFLLPEAEKQKLREHGINIPDTPQIHDPMPSDIEMLPEAEKQKLREHGIDIPDKPQIHDPMPSDMIDPGTIKISSEEMERIKQIFDDKMQF